jgi:hypothetical protein
VQSHVQETNSGERLADHLPTVQEQQPKHTDLLDQIEKLTSDLRKSLLKADQDKQQANVHNQSTEAGECCRAECIGIRNENETMVKVCQKLDAECNRIDLQYKNYRMQGQTWMEDEWEKKALSVKVLYKQEMGDLMTKHQKELEAARSEAEAYKEQAERYKKEIEKRHVENASLKKKAATVGDLQKKIGELEENCAVLGALKQELATTKKELAAEKKESAFVHSQLEKLQSRYQQLENWEKLKEDLARALSARDAYRQKCQELEKQALLKTKGKR